MQVILTPQQSNNAEYIQKAVAQQLQLPFGTACQYRIIRRTIDARQRNLKVLLTLQVAQEGETFSNRYAQPQYQLLKEDAKRVIIVGCGPAGLFCALTLLEQGIHPILLERGKDVSARKRDIAVLNRNQGLQTESNYCFGEGGAGTFSDGKLFSRSKKRGDMQRVLELFHFFGADDRVLYEAHPHIGSDKLPTIIKRIRETIVANGGEIHFEERVQRLLLENQQVVGCETNIGNTYYSPYLVLAIGHSAHDTYRLLAKSGVRLEPKGFAMGVRVEHPQMLIDKLMYHGELQSANLPAATYSLSTQVDGRGVYSFCMCPGGHIVPAGSEKDLCVVNGMSVSLRNSPYANSGMVVEIRTEDVVQMTHSTSALAGLELQEQVERLAFQHGAANNIAPAQRLQDFVEGKDSKSLPKCSYLPGIYPSRLDQWLPPFIGQRLRAGFMDFNRKYPGFITNDAVIVGVESRSSSAVRIPRNKDTMQHIDIKGLYPAGEGAGYAGGITSSALDGINVAQHIITNWK